MLASIMISVREALSRRALAFVVARSISDCLLPSAESNYNFFPVVVPSNKTLDVTDEIAELRQTTNLDL